MQEERLVREVRGEMVQRGREESKESRLCARGGEERWAI